MMPTSAPGSAATPQDPGTPLSPSTFPWSRTLVVAGITAGLYLILPILAPKELGGPVDIILLGIVLGLTVGIACRVDARAVPAMSVAATLSVIARSVYQGVEPETAIPLAVVIGAEIWVITYLLRRTDASRLRRPVDVVTLVAVACAVGLVSGLVAASVMAVTGSVTEDFWHGARTWAIDDVFGLVCITPAVLTLRRFSLPPRGRVLEFALVAAFALASTYLIFFVVTPGDSGLLGWPYLVVLGPLWIAVRMGVTAVAPVVAIMFWLVVVGTLGGTGSFAGAAPDSLDRLVAAELFGIVMSGVILILGTLRDDRLRTLDQLSESTRFVGEVVEASEHVVFAKAYGPDAPTGRYVMANASWARATGQRVGGALGKSDQEIFAQDVAAALLENDLGVLSANSPLVVEEQVTVPGAAPRTFSSTKFPLRGPDGKPWGVGGIATDITDLIQSREDAARQAQLLRAVFELSPAPAMRVRVDEFGSVMVLDANAAMCALMGARHESVRECDLLVLVHQDDLWIAREALARAVNDDEESMVVGEARRDMRMVREDGHQLRVLMSAAKVGDHDGTAEIVAQFEDISARRDAEEALADQALTDVVTGLPNRRALRDRMGAALRRLRRNPGNVTVLFCDLDRFKEVNDGLGHHVGDLLLIEVADRLQAALRPEDTLVRLGGDEFVVLSEGVMGSADALPMAMRLQARLGEPWAYDHQVFRPAMSIGIAMTTDPETSIDELLRRADLAMYRAKDGGRNRVEIYDRSVDEQIQLAVSVQHDLRSAIDQDALILAYQPIVMLSDESIVGAEALVRMAGRDGSLVPPNLFVPQAEISGLVVPMGAWVARRALTELRAWRDRGLEYSMAINVSPSQLRGEGFATYLLEQAELAGIDPAWLVVEVTETVLIHDSVRSGEELAVLSGAGVGIALDDFGTGFSSLTWLTQFPVDEVKIDKSFTDEVGVDSRKTAVVSALIQVARELGFVIVAEGIESEKQRDLLREMGVDRGQGYLFGRPTQASEPPWR